MVLTKTCLRLSKLNETQCINEEFKSDPLLENEVQEDASLFWFYAVLATQVPSLFTVPWLGSVSDWIGRKCMIILIPVFCCLQSLTFIFNASFMNAHPCWIIIGTFIGCFYGDIQGVYLLCYSHIADATKGSVEERTSRMGVLELTIAFSLIPAGGLIVLVLQNYGYQALFTAVLAVNLISIVYAQVALPNEQLTEDYSVDTEVDDEKQVLLSKKIQSECKVLLNESDNESAVEASEASDCGECMPADVVSNWNPLAHLKRVICTLVQGENKKVLVPLFLASLMVMIASSGEPVILALYLKNRPFRMEPRMLGLYIAVMSIVRGIGVIFFLQISSCCCKLSDWLLLAIGIISQVLVLILVGISRTITMVFSVNVTGFGTALTGFALRSIISKEVSSSNYGAALGGLECLDVMSSLLANCVSLMMYHYTLALYSGIAFFGLAGCMLIGGAFLLPTYCFHIKTRKLE